ncbi:type II toxin-antitoxin system RelE/ParE family toxin [Bartonella sp. DGB2]|uniref:type II toxin-antitoxin system RelE/ParE family toxin n=1 Tax=Bartonella sp. DGB2 TaxID=3388426 RepID=UPI00398FCA51
MQLEITFNAYADLDEIALYTTQYWGQKQAEKYLSLIYLAIDRIMENPRALLRSDSQISKNLFFYRVEQHFIFCDLSPKRLTVLTIQNAARDLPARLLDLEKSLKEEAIMLHYRLQNRDE